MRGHVRFEAQRTVVERNFPEDSGIQERLYVLVNGAQRNRRNPLSDPFVYQLRGGMFTGIDNGFVDDLSLEGKSKALFPAAAAEFLEGSRAQVGHRC